MVPAAGVIGEAMVALVLAGAMLEKFGGDSLGETQTQLRGISGTGEELSKMIYPIVKYGQPVLETQRRDDHGVRHAGTAQADRGHVRIDVRRERCGLGGAADRHREAASR